MFEASVISRTGQGAKAWLAFSAVAVGGLLIFSGGLVLRKFSADTGILVLLLGVLFSGGGLIVACFMVRCPGCHMRWVTNAMRRESAGGWLSALLTARVCPGCGYPDRASSPPNNRLSGRDA